MEYPKSTLGSTLCKFENKKLIVEISFDQIWMGSETKVDQEIVPLTIIYGIQNWTHQKIYFCCDISIPLIYQD